MKISLKQAIEYIATKHKPEEDEEEELLNGFDRKKTFMDISQIKLSVGKLRQLLLDNKVSCKGYMNDGIPCDTVYAFKQSKERKKKFKFNKKCKIIYSKSLEDYWEIEAYDEYNKFYMMNGVVNCCDPEFKLEELEQYIEKPIIFLEQPTTTEDGVCKEETDLEQPTTTEDGVCREETDTELSTTTEDSICREVTDTELPTTAEDGVCKEETNLEQLTATEDSICGEEIPKTVKLERNIRREVENLYNKGIKNETAIIDDIVQKHKGEVCYSKGNVKRYVKMVINKVGFKVFKNKQGRPRKINN